MSESRRLGGKELELEVEVNLNLKMNRFPLAWVCCGRDCMLRLSLRLPVVAIQSSGKLCICGAGVARHIAAQVQTLPGHDSESDRRRCLVIHSDSVGGGCRPQGAVCLLGLGTGALGIAMERRVSGRRVGRGGDVTPAPRWRVGLASLHGGGLLDQAPVGGLHGPTQRGNASG